MQEEYHTSPTKQATADGCDTLYNPTYDQTYHSTLGALTEARHVFLEATGVTERLQQSQPTRVLEVGFGTGLNFLLTAHHAEQAHVPLHFVSLEKNVLPAILLARLNHGEILGAMALQSALVAWRKTLPETPLPSVYHFASSDTITLDLLVGDATTTVLPVPPFDAVYLDAFSPDTNPELWTKPFLARLYDALKSGGRLTTYSAKGSVRRAMTAAGFAVEKRPGPPGKREMLVGVKP
ncbi:MAG TPA: tRNA (5-methylaminomethyl-2-thiouridine)(34)-methyltransferase MnmD [Rhodothermales bacterium]|nr:tRNA (5-methylaminomethyl-2-thiouridine)(34)-methyltransferase MnmD [Rhodothermales bacterium]